MDDREMAQQFLEIFEQIVPLLEQAKKGFFGGKAATLSAERARYSALIKSKVASAAAVLEKRHKDEAEKRFVNLFTAFQTTSLALENLLAKMETRVESSILFSEKALGEVRELFTTIECQFRDTKDYLLTGNPHLKGEIKGSLEKVIKFADECAAVHQERLITGLCMPQASYLYLDMIDSFKRIARGLVEFAEKA